MEVRVYKYLEGANTQEGQNYLAKQPNVLRYQAKL